jgi:hypothetical protein
MSRFALAKPSFALPAILSVFLVTVALAADTAPVDLDVSRIALFSSGVGYFECDKTVTGDATAELQFRTDQINDIIKSMVVQDFGGGKVGIISYASQDPIEKTLRSFGVNLTGKPTLGELLDQLRGEPVEITGPLSCSGIIVGVEKSPLASPDGKTVQEIERLTLLTDNGLQHIELSRIQAIKLLNPKVDAELRKALATLATAHDADKKAVVVNFDGKGDRKVRAAYLLEAPIWKTTYRLVLTDEKDAKDDSDRARAEAGRDSDRARAEARGTSDKKPFMQGWATVENATERDWKDVRLSLVSGRPISFRMDLYTPLYVPRPMEQLELYASLRPPKYEGGFEEADKPTEVARPAVPGQSGGSAGFQYTPKNNARKRAEAPVALPAPAEAKAWEGVSADIGLGGRGVESVAKALEAGELFAYNIDMPVSLARQHSAMLPIVNQEIDAAKVSIFNVATHPKYPLNGLELKNSTGLNLMQGPVTIFDANLYAGDAMLPDLKPDEKRLVAYALDLSTEVLIKQTPQPDEIVSLKIAKGTLWHRHKYVDQREYEIKNKADKPRTVIVEQAYSEDWKLLEPKEPYERTQALLRFKVPVPAKETKSQKVVLEKVADQSFGLTDAGPDTIRFYLSAKVISPKVKAALEKVIALRSELDDIARRRADLERQRDEANKEQGRVRENLKTLDKNTDAYQRQLKNFDDIDTKIAQLNESVDGARSEEQQKRAALQTYLLTLEVE